MKKTVRGPRAEAQPSHSRRHRSGRRPRPAAAPQHEQHAGTELPLAFPDAALAEATRLGTAVRPNDLDGRLDCRGDVVVTIDPAGARDFDDAFSIARDAAGGYRLRVHVADVAHYVRPGTAIDREARRRGNSTYLVDRVVPMLPEPLSEGLCSLRPGVDRLTRCVEFRIDAEGRAVGARIRRAVIRSRRRLTYEDALAVLARQPSGRVERAVHDAAALAVLRRARRFARGALPLEVAETRLVLDAQGRVDRVERVASDAAHHLIEELMLLANEAVASRLVQLRRPALHRVHDVPEAERLEAFRADACRARVPCGDLRDRAEIARLVQHLQRSPAGPTLLVGLLKTMPRARYDPQSLGHYGLATVHYTHFTSPIRRYADLLVHRALDREAPTRVAELDRLAEHLSATERNSAAAERASRDDRLFGHLEQRCHQRPEDRYEARIARLLPSGCLVDLVDFGVVALWRATGRGRAPRIGDRLRVGLAVVDVGRRRIEARSAGSPARSAARMKRTRDAGRLQLDR